MTNSFHLIAYQIEPRLLRRGHLNSSQLRYRLRSYPSVQPQRLHERTRWAVIPVVVVVSLNVSIVRVQVLLSGEARKQWKTVRLKEIESFTT